MLFRLLGPFEVCGPGGPVTLASARQRAVLAVLACTPDGRSRSTG